MPHWVEVRHPDTVKAGDILLFGGCNADTYVAWDKAGRSTPLRWGTKYVPVEAALVQRTFTEAEEGMGIADFPTNNGWGYNIWRLAGTVDTIVGDAYVEGWRSFKRSMWWDPPLTLRGDVVCEDGISPIEVADSQRTDPTARMWTTKSGMGFMIDGWIGQNHTTMAHHLKDYIGDREFDIWRKVKPSVGRKGENRRYPLNKVYSRPLPLP